MKKTTLFIAGFSLLFTSLSFAQESSDDDCDCDKNRAPYDFLDIFDSSRRDKQDVMTQTEFLLNFGFNQALGDGNGIGDDYRFWGSGYFDVGLEFSTKLSKAENTPRLTYGLSLRYSTLRISGDDREFATFDNVTDLVPLGFEADRSSFQQIGLHVPLHLEFGKREVQEYDDGIKRFGEGNNFVFGIGGYLGLTTRSIQRLEFEREGRDITTTVEDDFEINNFNYGLSAYAGYEDLQLYFSYGLNNILKDSPLEQNYVTLGIRLRG